MITGGAELNGERSEDVAVALRALHQSGFAQLDRTIDVAFAEADPQLVELCRWRVAQLLSGSADATPTCLTDRGVALPAGKIASLSDWDSSSELSDDEKAHLAFCEQFVTSVGHISDSQVQALLATRTEPEVYAFVSALYVIELAERLVLALTRAGGNR